jgi:hypothetical protein
MTAQFTDMSLPLPEAPAPAAELKRLPLPWDGKMAVTIDGIPWTITWALAAGRPEPIGVMSDGTRTVAGFPMKAAGKLGPLIAAALRQQARCLASYGETARARQLCRWATAAERPPGRQQYDKDLLRKVTETYNHALERGDYPARAVYDAIPGERPARLNRYIRRGRDFGLIPHTSGARQPEPGDTRL